MLWFITAFIVASAIFKFAPVHAIEHEDNNNFDKYLPIALIVLPSITLVWLVVNLYTEPMNNYSLAAIGFILTACTVALPSLKKLALPAALLTILFVALNFSGLIG